MSDDLGRLTQSCVEHTADMVSCMREVAMREGGAVAGTVAAVAKGPMQAVFAFRDAIAAYRSTCDANLLLKPGETPRPTLPPVVKAIGTLNQEALAASDAVQGCAGINTLSLNQIEQALQQLTQGLTALVAYLKADAEVQRKRQEAAVTVAERERQQAQELRLREAQMMQEEAARLQATAELEAQRAAFAARQECEAAQRAAAAAEEEAARQLRAEQARMDAEQLAESRRLEQARLEEQQAALRAEQEAAAQAQAARDTSAKRQAQQAAAAQAQAKSEAILLSGDGSDDDDGALLVSTDDLVNDLLESLGTPGAVDKTPAPQQQPKQPKQPAAKPVAADPTDDLVNDLLASLGTPGALDTTPAPQQLKQPAVKPVLAAEPKAATPKGGVAVMPKRGFGPKPGGPKAKAGGPKAKAGGPKAKAGGPKAKAGGPKAKAGGPKAKAGGPKPGRIRDSVMGKVAGAVPNMKVGAAHPKYGAAAVAAKASAEQQGAGAAAPKPKAVAQLGAKDRQRSSTNDALDDMLGWLEEQRGSSEKPSDDKPNAAPKRSNRPEGAVSTMLTQAGANAADAGRAKQPSAGASGAPARKPLMRKESFRRQSAVLDSMLDDILSTVDVTDPIASLTNDGGTATGGVSGDALMDDLLASMEVPSAKPKQAAKPSGGGGYTAPAPAAADDDPDSLLDDLLAAVAPAPAKAPEPPLADLAAQAAGVDDADALMDDLLSTLAVTDDKGVPSTESFAVLAKGGSQLQEPPPSESAAVLKEKLDKLREKKQAAVDSENFPLAASLKTTIDDLEAKYTAALQAGSGGGNDFAAMRAAEEAGFSGGDTDPGAAEEQLAALRLQIQALKVEKDQAVDNEDFSTAQRLKIEIDELEGLLDEGSILVSGGGSGGGAPVVSAAPAPAPAAAAAAAGAGGGGGGGGYEALVAAIHSGDLARVESLIDGPEGDFLVTHMTAEFDTALHVAVQAGKADICKVLVTAGSDPNALNKAGLSPMHIVVRKRYGSNPSKQGLYDELTKFFIEKGAGDLYLEPDDGGKTPLEEAELGYQKELQVFLDQLHARFKN